MYKQKTPIIDQNGRSYLQLKYIWKTAVRYILRKNKLRRSRTVYRDIYILPQTKLFVISKHEKSVQTVTTKRVARDRG